MQNTKTLETILTIAGFAALILGVVVAILNGKAIIVTSEKIADYLMIGGVILYLCGRQLRNRRIVMENNDNPEDEEKSN